MDTIGHHYIAEASGCNPEIIGKVEAVEQILVRAAEIAGVQVWSISFHRFNPNGEDPVGTQSVVVERQQRVDKHRRVRPRNQLEAG